MNGDLVGSDGWTEHWTQGETGGGNGCEVASIMEENLNPGSNNIDWTHPGLSDKKNKHTSHSKIKSLSTCTSLEQTFLR